jgi:ubiquinone/menaquinone biosynthesis C-methylase UbiE
MSLLEEYKNQARWRNWSAYIGFLPVVNKDLVLDIGCGIGVVTRLLSEKASRVIGMDNNKELLNYAENNNPSRNITYRVLDARSLNLNDLSEADGIWASFVAAYFPDFDKVLKNWLQILKPGGWIALVEMSGLFNHDPLSSLSQKIFSDYYTQQRNKNIYDFEMGNKLSSFLTNSGLKITHESDMDDPELTFKGPADPEIISAWKARFDRMTLFRRSTGDTEFFRIRDEFLSCISHKDHYSRTKVKFIIAQKP